MWIRRQSGTSALATAICRLISSIGASKADGFNLDVVQLRIDKPLDEADWAAGYRVDLWFGPDANTLGTQSSSDW